MLWQLKSLQNGPKIKFLLFYRLSFKYFSINWVGPFYLEIIVLFLRVSIERFRLWAFHCQPNPCLPNKPRRFVLGPLSSFLISIEHPAQHPSQHLVRCLFLESNMITKTVRITPSKLWSCKLINWVNYHSSPGYWNTELREGRLN